MAGQTTNSCPAVKTNKVKWNEYKGEVILQFNQHGYTEVVLNCAVKEKGRYINKTVPASS